MSDVPATMKAAVYYGPHDVRVEEVPTPEDIGDSRGGHFGNLFPKTRFKLSTRRLEIPNF